MARALAAAAEPFYAGAMTVRNRLYTSGVLPVRRLGRPVIGIGNLTTGGTGKTPVVRWLAERLRDAGLHVGIVARGYRATDAQPGDELRMLDQILNVPGTRSPVFVRGDPDRFAGGAALLAAHPEIDAVLLDDGFQHRRLGRDLDVVLVSAASPFGFGHVLPRGLMREPLAGLGRAGAIVLTHADQVPIDEVGRIESLIREHHATVPIYRAIHAHDRVWTTRDQNAEPRELDMLRELPFLAFSGIGHPEVFERQLSTFGTSFRGHRRFPDHHNYVEADLDALRRQALAAGAEALITTDKDWVKLAPLVAHVPGSPPIWRIGLHVRFLGDGEPRLLEQVLGCIRMSAQEKRLHGGG